MLTMCAFFNYFQKQIKYLRSYPVALPAKSSASLGLALNLA